MNYSLKDPEIIEKASIQNFLPDIGIQHARTEIIEGLQTKKKYISPKFFYNKEGSALFNKISNLEEYYLTRCEKEILASLLDNLDLNFKNIDIIELGSGDASKISLLFKQIPHAILQTINYYPVDIDQWVLERALLEIEEMFPINCTGIVADFQHQLHRVPGKRKRLFCFFGSTIGNFNPSEADAFLTQIGALMQTGDALLLGVDRIKDSQVLERAYNDKENITASFNKNILNTVNSIIESDFDLVDFEHLAFYNNEKARIEMHLRSVRNIEIYSEYSPQPIKLNKGETIHTENSHKFGLERLSQFGEFAGFPISKLLSDSHGLFSIVCYKKI